MHVKTLCVALWISLLLYVSVSCEKTYVPKPKAFHRIDLPKHSYVKLAEKHPFLFEHSTHATVKKHVSPKAEEHWLDIYYPDYRATIQLTYKALYKIKNPKKRMDTFYELINDSYKLASKHEVKASGIEVRVVKTPSNNYATWFELEGDVPSQFQFLVSDTNRHFLRGVLYFRTATKNDSLKPIIDFIKMDMMHLVNTLQWRI